MIRIGYAPGAFGLFHIGHHNLLRQAELHCDFLITGVVPDDVLIAHKGVTPVIPFAEWLEIVRNVRFVDAAYPAMTNDSQSSLQRPRAATDFRCNTGDRRLGRPRDSNRSPHTLAKGVRLATRGQYGSGVAIYWQSARPRHHWIRCGRTSVPLHNGDTCHFLDHSRTPETSSTERIACQP
jgi:cytidyltransferase-like protein